MKFPTKNSKNQPCQASFNYCFTPIQKKQPTHRCHCITNPNNAEKTRKIPQELPYIYICSVWFCKTRVIWGSLMISDTNLPDSLRDPPAATITLTLLVALATLPITISSQKLGRFCSASAVGTPVMVVNEGPGSPSKYVRILLVTIDYYWEGGVNRK